jgi:hypothetical protein
MKIQTINKGGIVQEIICNIIPDVVCCGGLVYPGVHVIDDDLAQLFETECAAYAIHEGRMAFDLWYFDAESDPEMAFCISEATSAELLDLRLLNAQAPPGAEIKTEDGYRLTVLADGTITDGDITYKSLAEMDVDFSLKSSIQAVLASLSIDVVNLTTA